MNFIECLEVARDVSKWDLADLCLKRCKDPITKVAMALGNASENSELPRNGEVISDEAVANAGAGEMMATSSVDDLFLSMDSLNYPWETLWDSFEIPWLNRF